MFLGITVKNGANENAKISRQNWVFWNKMSINLDKPGRSLRDKGSLSLSLGATDLALTKNLLIPYIFYG